MNDPEILVRSRTDAKKGGWWETLVVVVQALVLALVVRTFLFQPFNIPSGSMKSTLLVGDYLFVSKYAYGYSRYSFPFSFVPIEGRVWSAMPARGDIAVFKLPRDNATDYIKRVMALPGDRIQMVNGQVVLNGKPLAREALPDFVETDAFGNQSRVRAFRETNLEGKSYVTLDLVNNGIADNTPEFVVPQGYFFAMGDNRDNSTDSRFMSQVGFVPVENLVGRAEVIFYSIEDGASAWQVWAWPWTVRWSRLFDGLRP
jgi:signal peptidase I